MKRPETAGTRNLFTFAVTGACIVAVCLSHGAHRLGQSAPVAVTLGGGYDTDPRDHGRPVVLVAAGLGVPPEVFRAAFRAVRPAPAGEAPDPGQVRRNKDALLNALGPYGVTNELLDTVSNYYRYNGRETRVWRNSPARVVAVVDRGVVTGFRITDPGCGYSSPPTISVAGHPEVTATATLLFSRDLTKNGSLASVSLNPARR